MGLGVCTCPSDCWMGNVRGSPEIFFPSHIRLSPAPCRNKNKITSSITTNMAPAARHTFVAPRRDASLACSTIAGFGNRDFTSHEIISLTAYERTGVSTDFLG